MLAQQIKPFARSGLNQTGNQQPIDGFVGFVFANQFIEHPPIRAWFQPAKPDSATIKQFQYPVKVLQFFIDDLRHLAAQFVIVHVGKQQIHGTSGSLLFAMRVIDQNLGQVRADLFQPPFGRIGL